MIGDSGTWPVSAHRRVKAGDLLGTIADLAPEGFGSHLHLGLSTQPITGPDGMLMPMFRVGNWARLIYAEGTDGALDAVAAQAAAMGFIDPMSALRP